MKMAISSQSVATSGNEAWIGLVPPNGEPSDVDTSQNNTSTEGGAHENVIYAALQNGSINAFDLRTRNLIYASPNAAAKRAGALSAMAHDSSSHLLATGSAKGIVSLFDTRFLPASSSSFAILPSVGGQSAGTALFSFQRSNASIDDLAFVSLAAGETHPHLLVASADGFPYRASVHPDGPRVVEEYVGFADEGVKVVRSRRKEDGSGDDVWCAGDDGIVRRY